MLHKVHHYKFETKKCIIVLNNYILCMGVSFIKKTDCYSIFKETITCCSEFIVLSHFWLKATFILPPSTFT